MVLPYYVLVLKKHIEFDNIIIYILHETKDIVSKKYAQSDF